MIMRVCSQTKLSKENMHKRKSPTGSQADNMVSKMDEVDTNRIIAAEARDQEADTEAMMRLGVATVVAAIAEAMLGREVEDVDEGEVATTIDHLTMLQSMSRVRHSHTTLQ